MKKRNNKLFLSLSLMMGITIIISNYLVQFPIKYFNLEQVLTYGAFSYPITFLITDLANRTYGKIIARKIVYIGFIIGVMLSISVSTNFSDIISIRIAIGSGLAFFVAQNIDVNIFDKLRKSRYWFIPPFVSSFFASTIDTFLFFFISFYNTGTPWISLSFGDLFVKLLVALIMLLPFRILTKQFQSAGLSN
tara:strand:- start:380 stop:955 length:576 start_codon:yes stop_codon:yes gene_type:complete